MNKKTIYTLIAVCVLSIIGLQIFVLSQSSAAEKRAQTYLEAIKMQGEILYRDFKYSMINAGNLMENNRVYTDPNASFFLFDSINAPALMICVPESNQCSSCIDNAVNSVRDFFPDFSRNNRIILFSQISGSRLSSRVSRKHIYRCVSDSCNLGIINSEEQKPFYVVVHPDRRMSMFFIPDVLMPDLTKQYLNMIKEKYFIDGPPKH